MKMLQKYPILIVDDDLEFLNEAKEALADSGYEIFTATTGQTAIEAFNQQHPGVVIIDKKLPDLNGHNLIEKIKVQSPGTLIFLITGYSSVGSVIKGFKEGVTDYLVKPINFNELIPSIEKAIKAKEKKEKEQDVLFQEYAAQRTKYQTLFDKANDAIFILHTENAIIVDCNEAACKLIGYEKNKIVGKNQFFLFPQDESEKYDKFFKSHISVESAIAEEAQLLRKDGEKIPVSISTSVFSLGDKKYIQEIFRDLRQLKAQQAQIDRLRQYDILKSEFVANVAHELNNPLSIIRESIMNILDGVCGQTDQAIKKMLGVSKNETDRLLRFTKNMLDLSKIEAGKMPMHRIDVDLKILLPEIIEYFRNSFQKKNIELICDIVKAPDFIWADRDMLKEILINLINNALKNTPAGKKVFFHAHELDNALCIEVKDQGQGIAQDKQNKLFDKFYRVFEDKQEGSGLGLSIVKEIVSLHNGKIWVESKLGEGALFTVVIPIALRMERR